HDSRTNAPPLPCQSKQLFPRVHLASIETARHAFADTTLLLDADSRTTPRTHATHFEVDIFFLSNQTGIREGGRNPFRFWFAFKDSRLSREGHCGTSLFFLPFLPCIPRDPSMHLLQQTVFVECFGYPPRITTTCPISHPCILL
ncbi:unnamed protein product, partial [Ectocarpus sp. 8 AP-2014]